MFGVIVDLICSVLSSGMLEGLAFWLTSCMKWGSAFTWITGLMLTFSTIISWLEFSFFNNTQISQQALPMWSYAVSSVLKSLCIISLSLSDSVLSSIIEHIMLLLLSISLDGISSSRRPSTSTDWGQIARHVGSLIVKGTKNCCFWYD